MLSIYNTPCCNVDLGITLYHVVAPNYFTIEFYNVDLGITLYHVVAPNYFTIEFYKEITKLENRHFPLFP